MQFAIEVADFDADVAGNSRKLLNSICNEEVYFLEMIPEHVDLNLIFFGFQKIVGIPKDELIFETKPNDEILQKLGLLDFADYNYDRLSVFGSMFFSPLIHCISNFQLYRTIRYQNLKCLKIYKLKKMLILRYSRR